MARQLRVEFPGALSTLDVWVAGVPEFSALKNKANSGESGYHWFRSQAAGRKRAAFFVLSMDRRAAVAALGMLWVVTSGQLLQLDPPSEEADGRVEERQGFDQRYQMEPGSENRKPT